MARQQNAAIHPYPRTATKLDAGCVGQMQANPRQGGNFKQIARQQFFAGLRRAAGLAGALQRDRAGRMLQHRHHVARLAADRKTLRQILDHRGRERQSVTQVEIVETAAFRGEIIGYLREFARARDKDKIVPKPNRVG